MGRIRKYRPTDRWTDTQKQNASDHGYHQRGGIKSPANCKIQRHLSGCDRLNPHCVNRFCKGLNVKEVNLFAKVSHCRFNMELTMVSYSIKWVEILWSVSFFVFGLCSLFGKSPTAMRLLYAVEFLFHTEYWLTYVLLSRGCNMVLRTCMLFLTADFDLYLSNAHKNSCREGNCLPISYVLFC